MHELHDLSGGSCAHPQAEAVSLEEKASLLLKIYILTVSRIDVLECQKYCLFVPILFQIAH